MRFSRLRALRPRRGEQRGPRRARLRDRRAARCCSDALIADQRVAPRLDRRGDVLLARLVAARGATTAAAASTRARRTRWMIRWSWWPIALDVRRLLEQVGEALRLHDHA